MNHRLTGHDKPINATARALFYKAPWWAKAPPEKQQEILEKSEPFDITKVIDITKAPPSGVDRRGVTLKWKNGDTGIVVGYAYAKETSAPRNPANNKRPDWWIGDNWNPRHKNIGRIMAVYWWVFARGEFKMLRWKKPSERDWRASTDENQTWN